MDAGPITLRYSLSGAAGGRTVVLIHELGGRIESWQEVIPRLEPVLGVLAYDQRCAGGSSCSPEAFAFDDHVSDLAALLEAAKVATPVHLAGVASGAAIALLFAARYPALVDRIVLCSPAVAVAPDRRAYLEARSALAAREGMRAVVDTTLDLSYPQALRKPDVFAAYRSQFLANDPIGYGFANRAFAATTADTIVESVANRCLVLAGRFDLLRPPAAVQALAGRLRRADVEIVDSGHLMSVQAPGDLASRITEFLCK